MVDGQSARTPWDEGFGASRLRRTLLKSRPSRVRPARHRSFAGPDTADQSQPALNIDTRLGSEPRIPDRPRFEDDLVRCGLAGGFEAFGVAVEDGQRPVLRPDGVGRLAPKVGIDDGKVLRIVPVVSVGS